MQILDYLVVAVFMLGILLMGIRLSRRASSSTDEYILAGRKLPFWLAGVSISATGLNASTMLQDSRKIRQDGIAGMWFTWSNVINLMVGTIWFSRLWRRAKFVTQMEFYHARYSGRTATFCRVYDAVVYGVVLASIWSSVGLVGMKKIADVLLHLPGTVQVLGMGMDPTVLVVVALVAVTLAYSAASGVYGVVWTDLVEFIIALGCAYILLFYVYREVGWNVGLREKIEGLGPEGTRILRIMPLFGPVLFYYLLISPILNQGGYNPHMQRYLGVKNEREVVYTAVYNAVLNFGLRPWPYYICGLCGMFIISDDTLLANFPAIINQAGAAIPDYEKVFPALVNHFMPVGLVGLMVAGFLSAFMSSFDTNIHNSTSIFVNDIYRPYVRPGRSEKHYVRASRIYMSGIAIVATVIGVMVDDILMLTMLAFTIMTSAGWVKFLRFVWWRVNGAAEVAAQVVSLILTIFIVSPLGSPVVFSLMDWFGQSGNDGFFVVRSYLLIGTSTLASLVAILAMRPEPMDHLCAFYRRVRPFGWWGPVRAACGEMPPPESIPLLLGLTVTCTGFVFGIVFAIFGGLLAYGWLTICSILIALISGWGAHWGMRRLYPHGGGAEG